MSDDALDAAAKVKQKLWRQAGSPVRYKDADLPKLISARRGKMAVGAAGVVAAYGAHRLLTRKKEKKKNERDGQSIWRL